MVLGFKRVFRNDTWRCRTQNCYWNRENLKRLLSCKPIEKTKSLLKYLDYWIEQSLFEKKEGSKKNAFQTPEY